VRDCNLDNFAQNGECGPLLSPLGAAVNTTNFDPAALTGYGKRDHNWDVSAEVQHELRPRVVVLAPHRGAVVGSPGGLPCFNRPGRAEVIHILQVAVHGRTA
jgi:hypothetical protein